MVSGTVIDLESNPSQALVLNVVDHESRVLSNANRMSLMVEDGANCTRGK